MPDFERLRERDDVFVVDARSPEAFSVHIPGALNVGAGTSFSTWACTVLPEGAQTLLVVDNPDTLWSTYWDLLRIGYDMPLGWLAGGMQAWRVASKDIEVLSQWSVYDLEHNRNRDKELKVLDVRQPAEWSGGHIPGAIHISGGELPQRVDDLSGELNPDTPLAVICGSGYRSSVSDSLLKNHGYQKVFNVLGGMSAWDQAGFDVVKT